MYIVHINLLYKLRVFIYVILCLSRIYKQNRKSTQIFLEQSYFFIFSYDFFHSCRIYILMSTKVFFCILGRDLFNSTDKIKVNFWSQLWHCPPPKELFVSFSIPLLCKVHPCLKSKYIHTYLGIVRKNQVTGLYSL